MMQFYQTLILLLILLMASGCGERASLDYNPYVDCIGILNHGPESIKDTNDINQNWIVMGSSSAAGAGAQGYENSWAGKLQATLALDGINVVNIAHGGDTTYEALSHSCRISSARRSPRAGHNLDTALDHVPSVSIISYPSNDAAMGYSAEETVFNILTLKSALQKQGSKVIVISSQPRPMSRAKTNTSYKVDELLSIALSSCFVNVYSRLTTVDDTLKPEYDFDSVHLNDLGHQVVFDEIMEVIKSEECFATEKS